MKKAFAIVLVLGVVGGSVACGGAGVPGMSCKFKDGEVAASVQGEAKTFVDSAMELKKTNDALEAEWSAEIKAMGGELKVENPNEDNVLAKLNANVTEAKVQGQCDVMFDAKMDAAASGAADAAGSAGTGEASKAHGSATGAAHANVDVKFEMKCKAEAKVKATVDVTVASVKAHFPKLLGISMKYKAIAPQVVATADAGTKMMGSVKDMAVVPEIKCALEAMTGIKAQAKVDFSVHASASAKGEAKAG
ncbi:MAG: hypothetical protein NVS3B20_00220 [Polyangiales bacterium]